jgi:transcriptional regulator with XRE-family HTH domain
MLPIELQTPREMALLLAGRVKGLRLDRGWTQQELAARAGIALPTYRRFERTGSISLARLLMLSVILEARAGFDQLFVRPPARSLAELEELTNRHTRKRGKRREAHSRATGFPASAHSAKPPP